MKKVFKYIALATVSALALVSCDSLFDNLEGDLSKVDSATMFRTEAGITRVLAGIYNYMPSTAFSAADKATLNANSSRSSQSYYIAAPGSAVSYSQLRVIHNFLKDLEGAYEKGVISESVYNSMKGEALFIRAYIYFNAVRIQGGQPIVTESLDDKIPATPEDEMVYYSRETEKDTWDWVISELESCAELLPENPLGTQRIGKYTAYAMAAKAALWAASVSKYYDRAPLDPAYTAVQQKLSYMEKGYANSYYQKAIENAEIVIKSGHFALAGYNGTPLSVKASIAAFDGIFASWNASEGILGRSYNDGTSTNNGVEPSQTWGTANQVSHGYLSGAYSVTLNLVESFDDYTADFKKANGKLDTGCDDVYESLYLADAKGKNNSIVSSASEFSSYKRYDNPEDIFANKDARFQAWILYPGCTFRNTYIWFQGGAIAPNGDVNIYPNENIEYSKGGKSFYAYGGSGNDQSGFMNLPKDVNDNLRSDYAFMVRKYMDPNGYNDKNQGPWYEMRYSELLLTYAEAVAESGLGDKALAKQCLNDVRHRAAFTDDIDLTVANVLHEFKVEFALEARWPEVLFRRRAYAIQNQKDLDDENERSYKTTLVPVVDLSGAKAQYIFVRAYSMFGQEKAPKGIGTFTFPQYTESYYSGFSNVIVNHLINNNTK